MTLDEIIAQAKAGLVERSVDAVKAGLALLVPGSVAFFLSPFGNILWKFFISPAVKFVAKKTVDQMDVGGYYLYKTITNNADAARFEDTIRDERNAVESGNKDAIKAARAAKRAALNKLWPLTA